MTEYTYRDDKIAHYDRRQLISRGHEVSLISYDPERQLFVFDVLR